MGVKLGKILRDIIGDDDANIKKVFSSLSKRNKKHFLKEKFYECDEIIKCSESKKYIESIKNEILAHYYGISNQELEIISSNIFNYSYLKKKNIDEKDIVRYICTKNSIQNNTLKDKEIKSLKIKANLKYFKYLMEKYTKIIVYEQ